MFTQAELIPLIFEFTDVVMLGEMELIDLATEILDCKETGVVGVEVETKDRLSTFSGSEGSDDPIIALSDSFFPLFR